MKINQNTFEDNSNKLLTKIFFLLIQKNKYAEA